MNEHGQGYSAHSMRATFITMALVNGTTLDDVQGGAGHGKPVTSKLYDRIDAGQTNPQGHYEPTNCKWSDAEEQAHNKRDVLFHRGELPKIEGDGRTRVRVELSGGSCVY
jgi:hypothetical protein